MAEDKDVQIARLARERDTWHNHLQRVAVPAAAAFVALCGVPILWAFIFTSPIPILGEALGWIFANKDKSFSWKWHDSVDDWSRYYQFLVLAVLIVTIVLHVV